MPLRPLDAPAAAAPPPSASSLTEEETKRKKVRRASGAGQDNWERGSGSCKSPAELFGPPRFTYLEAPFLAWFFSNTAGKAPTAGVIVLRRRERENRTTSTLWREPWLGCLATYLRMMAMRRSQRVRRPLRALQRYVRLRVCCLSSWPRRSCCGISTALRRHGSRLLLRPTRCEYLGHSSGVCADAFPCWKEDRYSRRVESIAHSHANTFLDRRSLRPSHREAALASSGC